MRISDWSSDVCSSDLAVVAHRMVGKRQDPATGQGGWQSGLGRRSGQGAGRSHRRVSACPLVRDRRGAQGHLAVHRRARTVVADAIRFRSEENTSELQSLMRISYADFCLKKKKKQK